MTIELCLMTDGFVYHKGKKVGVCIIKGDERKVIYDTEFEVEVFGTKQVIHKYPPTPLQKGKFRVE